MKVLISKQDWIKATYDIKGKFYCPSEYQKGLLAVWPDNVRIEINATLKKKKKDCKCHCHKEYCEDCDNICYLCYKNGRNGKHK